jgi:hypothetical protein
MHRFFKLLPRPYLASAVGLERDGTKRHLASIFTAANENEAYGTIYAQFKDKFPFAVNSLFKVTPCVNMENKLKKHDGNVWIMKICAQREMCWWETDSIYHNVMLHYGEHTKTEIVGRALQDVPSVSYRLFAPEIFVEHFKAKELTDLFRTF